MKAKPQNAFFTDAAITKYLLGLLLAISSYTATHLFDAQQRDIELINTNIKSSDNATNHRIDMLAGRINDMDHRLTIIETKISVKTP